VSFPPFPPPQIREFHHQLEAAPPQQPLPRQQPLAAHAAAVVAAATAAAGSSKPLTPTSIALAIKRSTLDLIIKTGVAVADTVAVAGAAAVGSISASGLTTPGAVPRAPSASERASGRYAGAPAAPAPDPAAAAYAPPTSPRPQSPLEPPPPPPPPRAALTRPELALCLLSEIACERDEELRPHLAPLLHVAVLHADSACATVRLEACQLLQYLLYSLACKPLESQAQGAAAPGPAGDYARVSGVIGYLQSLGGEPLWPREQPTLAHPWVPSAGFVAAFVQLTVDCFCFDGALRERWSAEALKWACCAASRHAASRSHQVYAALGPRLSSSSATALLAALQKCLQNATPEGLDTAVELLCTLRVVLANTPPRKMLLYPHVLAACVALLNSSVVRVGELAAALLVQLLDAVDLSTAAAQQALMSVLPPDGEGEGGGGEDGGGGGGGGRGALPRRRSRGRLAHAAPDWESWPLGQGLLGGAPDVDEDLAGGPWLALQQLLVKALFQPDTEALALEAMAAVAQQVARAGAAGRLRPRATSAPASGRFTVRSLDQALAAGGGGGGGGSGGGKAGGGGGGIEAVLGSAEVGLAISLSAALPWLCVHVGGGALAAPCAAFLRASAGAAAAVGWRDLSFVLAALAAGPPPAPAGAASWLPDLMEVLCAALFPAHSRLAVQRLMEAAARGAPAYQAAALACLRAVFRVPGLDLGSPGWFAEGSGLVEALSGAVGGPMGPQVLEVLQAMAAFKGAFSPFFRCVCVCFIVVVVLPCVWFCGGRQRTARLRRCGRRACVKVQRCMLRRDADGFVAVRACRRRARGAPVGGARAARVAALPGRPGGVQQGVLRGPAPGGGRLPRQRRAGARRGRGARGRPPRQRRGGREPGGAAATLPAAQLAMMNKSLHALCALKFCLVYPRILFYRTRVIHEMPPPPPPPPRRSSALDLMFADTPSLLICTPAPRSAPPPALAHGLARLLAGPSKR
jgi:hypothetical protein